jgi:hypothetical protein
MDGRETDRDSSETDGTERCDRGKAEIDHSSVQKLKQAYEAACGQTAGKLPKDLLREQGQK